MFAQISPLIIDERERFFYVHRFFNPNNLSILSNFPNSKKVYVQGSRPDIKVPMREIQLSPTTGTFGNEENPPLRVYDTSGPYTDENYQVDITKGLPPIRDAWIRERNDTEEYEGRKIRPEDNGFRVETRRPNRVHGLKRKPLQAKPEEMS